ncbi:hypothetical protein [Massilia aerilata]|uniref:DUF4398 domain-containing protein n=1 Tax=Massilia aerilata TaxID=453817 RepID=A0ABW0S0K8_9BURK
MRTPPHVILLLGAATLWAAHARAAEPLIRRVAPEVKLAYQQARELAAANYKNARAQCDAVTGNPKDLCIAEAKAARVRMEEEARAKYEDTLNAFTRARLRIADANYDRDKVRCDGFVGNDKDVCQAQAKATLVAARADAKADQKTIEARNEARDDKLAAAWKIAMERCDAFAGAAKDQCVSDAKVQFGK